jgi:SAM-dependent methyltransferase
VEEPLRAGEIALNLGSGRIRWPGWVNVDAFSDRADLGADLLRLPLPNDHADRIAAIHVFEHFYLWETEALLAEWKRVLKPGGSLVLELPCMDKVFGYIAARLAKNEQPAPAFSWLALWGDPKHKSPAMCHRWGYFKSDMGKVLTDAGFTEIRNEEPRYHFPCRDMRMTATKPKGD